MTAHQQRDKMKTQQNVEVLGMTPQWEVIHLRQQLKERELEIAQTKLELVGTQRDLEHERNLRMEVEKELRSVLEDRDRNWKRKLTKEERDAAKAERLAAKRERQETGLKSDGKPISTPADEFASYTEMQQFLSLVKATGRLGVRNWAMIRVGVCLGLRISDLIRLRWCHFLNQDGTWRDRLRVIEQKTEKLNKLLITDAIKETLLEYRQWLGAWSMNGYVFAKTTGEPMTPKHGSQILVDVNKIAGLPKHISSHTMRKTFANIIVSCYDGGLSMDAMDKACIALNHDSLQSTRHYLGTVARELDNARQSVSDFVLGKSDIDKLGIPKQRTNNDLWDAIEQLRQDIQQSKEES